VKRKKRGRNGSKHSEASGPESKTSIKDMTLAVLGNPQKKGKEEGTRVEGEKRKKKPKLFFKIRVSQSAQLYALSFSIPFGKRDI